MSVFTEEIGYNERSETALVTPSRPSPHLIVGGDHGMADSQSSVRLSGSELRRFFSYIAVSSSGCWLWTGGRNKDGYGIWSLRGHSVAAHRLSHRAFVGPIPDGLQIDHRCDTPACVNPAHLWAVTPRENTLRSSAASALNARKTHCPLGHLLVRRGSSSRRFCRICDLKRHAVRPQKQDRRGRHQQRRAQGLCVGCGNPSETYRCGACRELHNRRDRGRDR